MKHTKTHQTFLTALKTHGKRLLNKDPEKGFTLIELLLVIGIIAILAAIVILAINPRSQLTKAEDARRTIQAREIKSAITQYQIDNGFLPNSITTTEQPICAYNSASTSSCAELDLLVDNNYLATFTPDIAEIDSNNLGYSVVLTNGRPVVTPTHLGALSGSDGDSPAATLFTTGLVAYWNMENFSDSDGIVDDEYGSHHGTDAYFNEFMDSQTEVASNFDVPSIVQTNNYSLVLDDNEEIIVPDDNNLSFTNGLTDQPFSIMSWVKQTSSDTIKIALKLNDATKLEYTFLIDDNSQLELALFSDGYSNRIGVESMPISLADWTHVAATYDGSGNFGGITLYVNGLPVTTSNISLGTYTGMINGNGAFRLGGASTDYFSNLGISPFGQGKLDDIRLYNFELTPQNVLNIFNAQG